MARVASNVLTGEAKDLLRQLGAPLANFRDNPKGPIKNNLLKKELDKIFSRIFRSVNTSFKTLISRSSPNYKKGPYKSFGPPGAVVSGELLNCLTYGLRVDSVAFVGRVFEFDVSYDPEKAPHFRALDTGTEPHTPPPWVILDWAARKFGWNVTVFEGTFDPDDYDGIKVSMPNGEEMSVSSAVWLLSKGIRNRGLKALNLREHIATFIEQALERQDVPQQWLNLITKPAQR